jgi:hypothetical protein
MTHSGAGRQIRHVVRSLPSQRRFYQSTAKYKGFSGPVGSGKTHALCHEALRASGRNLGCTGLIGGPTDKHLSDVTIPALARWSSLWGRPWPSSSGAATCDEDQRRAI